MLGKFFMQLKTKVLLFIATLILMGMILTVFIVIPQLKNYSVFLKHANENFSVGISLSEVDEIYLDDYKPKYLRSFDVLHYNIHIQLFPDKEEIKGDVEIKILVNDKSQKEIELNFYENLKIDLLTLNSKILRFKREEKKITLVGGNIFTDTILIKAVYHGKPKRLGFGSFTFDKSYGKPLVYTLNEPVFASTWFPCIDVPDDKAMADIFITNDSAYSSLSNGKLISVKNVENKKTYHWKTYYPISTYLISIYSAIYKSHSDKYITAKGDTIDLYCYATPENFENAIKDFSDHKEYLSVFEELFGEYAFQKEKYAVAEFGWNFGAMEHQTITGLGTRYITGKKFFQDMIIHELAHHWWGNAVGLKTWKDVWLNEGFSTYSEALYWEKKSGFDALKTTLQPKFGDFSTGTLYNPEINLFIKMIYDKGAWVLHMLRKEIGDELFFKLLRIYYDTFKYKNASTEDFKNLAQNISNKNLAHFFDQWVYKGVGIIDLDIKWTVNKETGSYLNKIYLNQVQNGYDIYKFPIDIKFVSDSSINSLLKTFYVNDKTETFSVVTKYKPREIIIDPEKWLLAKCKVAKGSN
ncbi:MAG: M1 family metallopeptidase [Ignavibacteria bacterium]|nr:M1 family metallopeptidase [Ignavibacteria bacterium]